MRIPLDEGRHRSEAAQRVGIQGPDRLGDRGTMIINQHALTIRIILGMASQVDLPHRVEKLTGVQVTHVVAEPPPPEVRAEPAREPESYGVLSPLAALSGKRPERVPRQGS